MQKMTKKRTTTTNTIKLANFVGSNKAAFEGKSKHAVLALIEATFPGEYFSTGTIAEILAVNGVNLKRQYSTTGSKSDRVRALARILQLVIVKLTDDLGTELLNDDHMRKLSRLIGGNSVEG